MEDLAHLFSGYFYEAWDEYEYESWETAVDDFARRSPERVAGAIESLQDLIAEELSDAELDERLRSAGCTYVPQEGVRAWLDRLLAHLRSESAGSRPLHRTN